MRSGPACISSPCPAAPLTALAILVMAVYTLLAGKAVHGGSWAARLVRAGVLSAVHAAMLAVAVPRSFLLALLLWPDRGVVFGRC
jgi:hypothetical protein